MQQSPSTVIPRRKTISPLCTDLAAIALLAALCSLFFWPVLTPTPPNQRWFPGGDFYDPFFTYRYLKAVELRAGHLPLWNPFTYGGQPFLADIQTAVFYPINLVAIALTHTMAFSPFALGVEVVFHYFLASVFTYLLGRRLFRRRASALLAAIAFPYGGYLAGYPRLQLGILEVEVWLPLVLFLIDLGTKSTKRAHGFAWATLAGLAAAMAAFAGFPQALMFILYAALAYFALSLLPPLFNGGGRGWGLRRRDIVLQAALFLVVGLGVAAVQLVPTAEFAHLSNRAEMSFETASGGMAYLDLIQILLPGSVSQWWPVYIGIVPLMLAAIKLVAKPDRKAVFWGGLALFALLASFGGNNFFYNILYLFVPGFGLFRNQERTIFLFSFALAVLAGYGCDVVLGPLSRRLRAILWTFRRGLIGLAIGALAAMVLFYFGLKIAPKPESFYGLPDRALILAMLLGVSIAILGWRLQAPTPALHRKRGREREGVFIAAMLLSITVLDLFTYDRPLDLQKEPAVGYYQATPLIETMQADRSLFRIQNDRRYPEGFGYIFRLQDIGGSSPMELQRYETFTAAVPEARRWQLLGVKYVVTWRQKLDLPSEIIAQEPQGDEMAYLHRLTDPWPRAWLVHQAEVLHDDQTVLDRLAAGDFDGRRVAILAEPPSLPLPGSGNYGDKVVVTDYAAEHIVVETDSVENALLVLSEIDFPGWHATIDGQPASILRADYVLRAVALPKGHHRVELVYDPLSFKLGLGLSVATLLLAIGVLVAGFAPAKTHP